MTVRPPHPPQALEGGANGQSSERTSFTFLHAGTGARRTGSLAGTRGGEGGERRSRLGRESPFVARKRWSRKDGAVGRTGQADATFTPFRPKAETRPRFQDAPFTLCLSPFGALPTKTQLEGWILNDQ